MTNIGQQIRSKRKQNNLTQAQLAEKIGTTDKAVSNMENSHRLPSLKKLKQIATALGCEVEVLLK
jgi:transcriptional regulator with XRE-family HTH domain